MQGTVFTDNRGLKPYNAYTVANFIDWVNDPIEKGEHKGRIGPRQAVYHALSALQFIEEGLLAQDAFRDKQGSGAGV